MQDAQETFFRYGVYYPTVALRGQWVPRYLRECRETQWYDEERLARLQSERLAKLLQHSRQSVKAYQSIEAESINADNSFDILASVPPVSKSEIVGNAKLYTSQASFWFLTPKTTGGSTGRTVTIPKTRDALARELAATWRSYEWAGVTIGDRQARLWGVPRGTAPRLRAALIDFIANRRRLSAFGTSEQELHRYCVQLLRFKPRYIYGYASLIVRLAQFEQEHKLGIGESLRCIISTSEVLTESMRTEISSSFERPVLNEYGCGELGSVAHECEKGGMHVMAENMIVEILDGERPCGPGETGELTITELNNLAMPLIRYRTGDFAAWSKLACACGRGLPTLDHIYGRAYDYISNSEGKEFHPEFFMYIMEDAKRKGLGVESFQVVERAPLHLTVRIVPGPAFGAETTRFIVSRIREGFDAGTTIDVETTSTIEREPSGKMRLVKALAQHQLRGAGTS